MVSVCIDPASHSAASPVGDSSVTSVPMALGRFDDVSVAVRNRRARVAVAALFLTNGALFANLLPRYPEIKADLALSNSAYGVAIAAFSAGALVAGPAAAAADPPLSFFGGRGRQQHRHRSLRVHRLAGAVGRCTRHGAVHRRRVRRDHRRRAERPCTAAAAELRALDHQLTARGVVGGGGARRRDGCGRDRVGHPTHDTLGGVGGVVQRRGPRRVSISAPRPGHRRSPVGAGGQRRPTRIRGLRDAGRAGVHRDRRGCGRGCGKLLGHSLFAGQSRYPGCDRGDRVTSRWSASSSSAG